jgi:hypothetical protein
MQTLLGEEIVPSEKYNEIEIHLLNNSKIEKVLTDPIETEKKLQKQQQAKEIARLSVFGVFAIFLSLFAPLLMKQKINRANKRSKSI